MDASHDALIADGTDPVAWVWEMNMEKNVFANNQRMAQIESGSPDPDIPQPPLLPLTAVSWGQDRNCDRAVDLKPFCPALLDAQ